LRWQPHPGASAEPDRRAPWIFVLLAILLGGAVLVWPAALNGYPLLFIDTTSYLRHTLVPEVPWDKAPIYGPLIHLFHARWTLWAPILAQGMLVSWLLWLAQRGLRGVAGPVAHLLLMLGLAGLTSAAWFIATVMPDALTAVAPLCLFLLAFGRLSRVEALAVGLCGALAIGAHLSHLPTAFALLLLTALLTRRLAPVLRVAAPLVLAMLLLAGLNLVNFGRVTLSPHGVVFLLARLQDDGPAAALLRDRCGRDPASARWHLCGFLDQLPMDSDVFLWGYSPLHSEADGSLRPQGHVRAVPEAREIIAATLATYPLEVATAMLANTLRQLTRFRVGDTLDDELILYRRSGVEVGFPDREVAAFDAGLQARSLLPAAAEPWLLPHLPLLLLALAATPILLWRAWRTGDLPRGALILFAVAAIGANAFATGALSKPHERYGSRMVWILPAALALALRGGGLGAREPGTEAWAAARAS
jgi:hypothetical protein